MAPFVSRPLGMPKRYPYWIEDSSPAGLVHTVWYFDKSVQTSMKSQGKKHNRELWFWAHGGNGAENVGKFLFPCILAIALIRFIWNKKPSSAHKSVSLPLCCYTEGVWCHIFHNKVKRFWSKLRKNGQYLSNSCIKGVHYSQISFLIQPIQWRSNPQTMVHLHIVFSW